MASKTFSDDNFVQIEFRTTEENRLRIITKTWEQNSDLELNLREIVELRDWLDRVLKGIERKEKPNWQKADHEVGPPDHPVTLCKGEN